MLLKELLDSVGLGNGEFAKLANVNRKTVGRWLASDMEADDEMLSIITKYKDDMTNEQSEEVPIPSQKIESMISHVGIQPVSHRNIAFSRIKYGREGMAIDDVARMFGLSVVAYNLAVQDTIIYCQDKGTSFQELRE